MPSRKNEKGAILRCFEESPPIARHYHVLQKITNLSSQPQFIADHSGRIQNGRVAATARNEKRSGVYTKAARLLFIARGTVDYIFAPYSLQT